MRNPGLEGDLSARSFRNRSRAVPPAQAVGRPDRCGPLVASAPEPHVMDHHVPKRRVPVTLWSTGLDAVAAQLFLDLDPVTRCHQTILGKLDESLQFLPAAVGERGRIHLFNKRGILRVTPGKSVVLADVFSRGFRPAREEEAELTLVDGTELAGRVWMPLERETQRLSDYVNQTSGFLVVLTPVGPHLVHPCGVAEMRLGEHAEAPLDRSDATAA